MVSKVTDQEETGVKGYYHFEQIVGCYNVNQFEKC